MKSIDAQISKLAILMDVHHVGRENAITADELVAGMNTLSDGKTQWPMRSMLRMLVTERDLPIVSCSAGYYVAETEGEVNQYLESLESRIRGIRERKNSVRYAAHRRGII